MILVGHMERVLDLADRLAALVLAALVPASLCEGSYEVLKGLMRPYKGLISLLTT